MVKHQFTYYKQKLTTGLLAIMLLFSTFSWSGYIYEAPAPLPAVTKTEIAAVVYPDSKKGISYQRACTLYYKKNYPTNCCQPCFSTVIWHYNRLVKIKADHYTQILIPVNTATRFSQVKIIPQNPNEYLLRSLGV